MMVSIFMCRLLLVVDFVVVFVAAEAGWIAVKIRFKIAFSAGVIVGMKTGVAEHELLSAARAEDSITVVVNVPYQSDFSVAVGADFGLFEIFAKRKQFAPCGIPVINVVNGKLAFVSVLAELTGGTAGLFCAVALQDLNSIR